MRIAPIALYGAAGNRLTIDEADRLASDAAEITHQHPLGVLPAALMVHIIYCLMQDSAPTCTDLVGYVNEGLERMAVLFPHLRKDIDFMARLMKQAITLADNDQPDQLNIEHLGGGWVAEETLAIALYSILRHYGDFEHAIIAAVNHSGDSDSTGAVTGNILGTVTGYDAIPQFYKDDLEMHDVILRIADELTPQKASKLSRKYDFHNVLYGCFTEFNEGDGSVIEQEIQTSSNSADNDESELIVYLTIKDTVFQCVEVLVSEPALTIKEQIERIMNVFDLPRHDEAGNPKQYVLGEIMKDDEPRIFEFEGEDGREMTLMDYNVKKGTHLCLTEMPLYG